MKRNPTFVTDVAAGVILAASLALPLAQYTYGANQIAQGNFGIGGDLTGIYPLDMPELLSNGGTVFALGIPTIAAYLTWMFFHRVVRTPAWVAVLIAIPISIVVGYPSTVTQMIAPEEADLAIQSALAILACLAVVAFELVAHRRAPHATANAVSPKDESAA